MESPKYTWIQTRDGSPTLWSNDLGESFRSVKGAFTESWAAFVGPGVGAPGVGDALQVGEFGLGAGTNWMLWTLASRALGIRSTYFAIERDPTPFHMGFEQWIQDSQAISSFLKSRKLDLSSESVASLLRESEKPQVFPSLQDAIASGITAHVWFHDPFGYDVNPEGYSPETLLACSKLWAPNVWGGSYACNRAFRESLQALPGISARVVPTGGEGLKRERLEFFGKEAL
jgi:hypothetical protein